MIDNNEVIEQDDNWLEEVTYKYVIGQDPGGTTGVAVLRYTDNTPPELVYLHQIPDGREGFFYFFVGTDVGEGTDCVSVSEKWETREGIHSANLEPVYIEGVQYAIWIDQTIYQSPRVKNMVGDEFLKANNLWTEGKRHQMDALLHALYYLRSIGHEPTLEALAGEAAEPLAEPGEADEKTLPQPGGSGGEGDDAEGGEPGEGEGGGSPQPGGFEEAMRQMAERSAAAQAALEELAEALEKELESGGEGHGPKGDGDVEAGPDKPKKTLNGAFMGFAEDDD